jgi:ribosomal protein L21E
MRTESTSNSTFHEDGSDPPSAHSRPPRITHDYKPGDIVEVKVDNLYQVGMVDSQPFKGVYNVTLFSDTPAWNEKRAHVDIYQHSPERMPEVLSRDMRPFTPAPMGEIVFVFVNGSERKCCVHGYSYDGSDELSPSHMKYVVKFAKKDGEWRHEKHRVPVQRAYRKLYAV